MDQAISLKNYDEFINNNVFINLNDTICQDRKDDVFDQEILDNYAAKILDTKYKQFDTNNVAANQKQLNPNQNHELQYLLAKYKKYLMGLLVSIQTKGSILTYCPAQNLYTTAHTQFLVPMNKPSKKNSNTWLTLEFQRMWCLWVGLSLLHHCQNRWPSQKNIWPLISKQICQLQTISTANYSQFLHWISGYKFFTKVENWYNNAILHFKFDGESQELCVIITLFGKYKCKRLLSCTCCILQHQETGQHDMWHGTRHWHVVKFFGDRLKMLLFWHSWSCDKTTFCKRFAKCCLTS